LSQHLIVATADSNSQLILQVPGLGSPLSDTQTRKIQMFRNGFVAASWFPVDTCLPPHIAFMDDRIYTKYASVTWISTTITTEQDRLRTSSKGRQCIPSIIQTLTWTMWQFWKRRTKYPLRVSFFLWFYFISVII
jgi:hypothetical protein